ncbi:phosphotransferase system lactose/cellobiose-specific IIB subunit [Coriobacterium glomerans PW2]|uniref:Phosphotransferase system lactose/cellobiose-specific IIB subunit n=1 Tax=Coriobacterium glomerans (strain ATCC 49209 / DSM 20642 / JCM 10262 / PW2) TaxID=700015 RepID=F2NBA6_CORGP|nr:PTS sugar transporter subunit IIB [Coriobacterium glomerans]AEB06642.1 phosphotransferase system lactose/cellobiose-specific IIB subunit [Coriobacterium glomerans PW2]
MSKIMLACAAGMSTSMLVGKMQRAAEALGIDVEIIAVAANDVDAKLASERPDVLMLGPQVRFMKGEIQAKTEIPVSVIDMKDYGRMNGEAVLKAGLGLIERF